jgi:hypothetical protein
VNVLLTQAIAKVKSHFPDSLIGIRGIFPWEIHGFFLYFLWTVKTDVYATVIIFIKHWLNNRTLIEEVYDLAHLMTIL